jgi:DNA-directed RNA polymerase subunit RPC12/RpoP
MGVARRGGSLTMCMGCGKRTTYEEWLRSWDAGGVMRCPLCGMEMKVMHRFDDGETEWLVDGRWRTGREGCMTVYGDLG